MLPSSFTHSVDQNCTVFTPYFLNQQTLSTLKPFSSSASFCFQNVGFSQLHLTLSLRQERELGSCCSYQNANAFERKH